MSKSKRSITAIGLMSGTSMDGVDAALLTADLSQDNAEIITLGAHLEIPFDAALRADIAAVLGAETPSSATQKVETQLGFYYNRAVAMLLQQAGLDAKVVDIIGLHGQTITHKPEQAFTWQLGNGADLAAQTGIDVVYDFRQNDLQHGGQGAPLAPVFHLALAQSGFLPPLPLVMVNIGGVSNITLLANNIIRAYDTGSGNGPMDDYAREFLRIPFDEGGQRALAGQTDKEIVRQFLTHPYFGLAAPKSLDRKDFSHDIVRHLSPNDALRTLCACSANAIAMGIREEQKHAPNLQRLILAGGGRHNKALCAELQHALPQCEISMLDDHQTRTAGYELNGDALEAWAFAWLAVLKLGNLPASFPTTTGVNKPQTAGKLILAKQPLAEQ